MPAVNRSWRERIAARQAPDTPPVPAPAAACPVCGVTDGPCLSVKTGDPVKNRHKGREA